MVSDPDYDEIELLIDTDPIELGKRLRTALAEVARMGRRQDQLVEQINAQRETIRRLRALVTSQGWELHGESMGR